MLRACLCAVVVVAAWMLSARPIAAQGLNTPPAVQAGVKQSLALVSICYRSHSRLETDQAGQDFEQLLNQIGTQISPSLARQAAATEGGSIVAKILLIAWDRRQRPQVYQKIAQDFIEKAASPHRRILLPPMVPREYRKPEYRLPWEFFLMRPPSMKAFGPMESALDALGTIGDPASLSAFTYIFQLTTQDGVEVRSDAIQDTQKSMLGAILEFRNPQGVEALLTCIVLSDAQQAELARHKETATPQQLRQITNEFGWETHGYLAKALVQQVDGGWWRKSITAYPAAVLTAGQKDVIEKVKNYKGGQANP